MKKFFFIAVMAFVTLVSCQKQSGFTNKDVIGVWKATKIEATMKDGSELTITDEDELENQLDGLEYIMITETYIQMMEYGLYGQVPYYIEDDYIEFIDYDVDGTLHIESVSDDKMVIQFVGKYWTSLIYYTKVKK